MKSPLIRGTLILTLAGFLTRIIGFLFRIFLNRKIGAEGLGIYQLIFPLQIIGYSLCMIGFETTISKMTAAGVIHTKRKDGQLQKHYPGQYLKTGLFLSLLMSVLMAVLVYWKASYISCHLLFEPRCIRLVKTLALSFPLTSIHACICGYYIGCKNTKVTAISQILEQSVRVLSITAIIFRIEQAGHQPTALSAVMGTLAGECAATAFCILHLWLFHDRKPPRKRTPLPPAGLSGRMIRMALPISLNRLMLSILQSIQSVLIPSMLIRYGYTPEKSLAVYGILLGLVIPFILFPGALINSMSLLLLPTISQAEKEEDQNHIQKTTGQTLLFCLGFGILCAGVFIGYGNEIGLLLLSSRKAGHYLCLLGILCPFFYISSTLTSIINGLGKTGIPFLFGVFSTLLQIVSIFVLMPKYGIYGYLSGFLVSNILQAVCLYGYARMKISIHIKPFSWILYPASCMLLSIKAVRFLFSFLPVSLSILRLVLELAMTTLLFFRMVKPTN